MRKVVYICDFCGEEFPDLTLEAVQVSAMCPREFKTNLFSPWHNKYYPQPVGHFCSWQCLKKKLDDVMSEYAIMRDAEPK